MAAPHVHNAITVRLRKLLAEVSSGSLAYPSSSLQLLINYLDSLSNAQFRVACQSLSDELLPSLPRPVFWTIAQSLVAHNRKAFLVTTMKRIAESDITEDEDAPCASFLRSLQGHDEDVRKLTTLLLPRLNQPSKIRWLLRQLGVDEVQKRLMLIMQSRASHRPLYFVLLGELRQVEHQRSTLLLVARTLIQRGDSLSWNMAALLRSFFGLTELQGTFSLRVQPYELSSLSTDYAAFSRKLSE